MSVRIASLSRVARVRWGRSSLVFALCGVSLVASCTKSEDTEPYVPAKEGARQPEGTGDLISEDDACERLLKAATEAYDRLRCEEPSFPSCPAFLRPGGGNGCYEYREGSVEACESAYDDAPSCRELAPCFATAELNVDLPTCELVGGEGGAGGVASGGAASMPGGADAGGAVNGDGGTPSTPVGGNASDAGAPAAGGQGGAG